MADVEMLLVKENDKVSSDNLEVQVLRELSGFVVALSFVYHS